MEAPGKVIRYQKQNVDFRIFADTPEFIESCDKGFKGMDDVTRTEYVRADILAAKDAEIESARKSTDYWKAELYAANSEIDLLRGLLSEAVENPASATEHDGATLWRCHFCEAEMYNGGEHHEGCLVLRAALKEVE